MTAAAGEGLSRMPANALAMPQPANARTAPSGIGLAARPTEHAEEPPMRIVMTCLLMAALPPLAMANELDEMLDVQPGGTLHIGLDCGTVEVEAHDANQVRITARASGWAAWSVNFGVWREGNDVYLAGESSGWGAWLLWPFGGVRVHVRAWVPRDYSVMARTAGGGIALVNLNGRISAETQGGPVALKGASGVIELRTSGGKVDVRGVNGSLNAETSGGAVTITKVAGDVWARTSGGRIEIREASGEVDAATSGGNIYVSFVGAPAGRFETSGGSIEVRIPQDAGADIEAHTSGGRVAVAQQLRLRADRGNPDHVVGTINGGGAPLRLRTSGGNIDIDSL
jgi:hypothetical protein